MAPPVLAALRSLFAGEEIPWALNIYGTGVGVAVAGGQLLGGVLIAADIGGLGWRSAFLINVPIGLAAIGGACFRAGKRRQREAAARYRRRDPAVGRARQPRRLPLDRPRARLGALGARTCSPHRRCCSRCSSRSRSGWRARAACRCSIPPCCRSPRFRRGLVVALLFFFTTPFYLFFSLYLQAGLGEGALAAGLAVLPYGVANFIGPMMATRRRAAFAAAGFSASAWRVQIAGLWRRRPLRRDPDRRCPALRSRSLSAVSARASRCRR